MKKHLVQLILVVLTPAVSPSEVIVIRGSDALGAKLIPMLCESYKNTNSGIEFEIAAEGSSSAFSSLLNGSADIGMSSRETKKEERESFSQRGLLLRKSLIAYDGLRIAVNKKNPVDNLSKAQVEGIFSGDILDWSSICKTQHTISIYTRNTSSGVYSDFKKLAMSGRDYSSTAVKLSGSTHPAMQIAEDEFGITYIGLAYGAEPGVKLVKIENLEPPHPDYPYYMKLYLFTRDPPKDSVLEFIKWCMSSREAHAIISRVGFIPAEKIKNTEPNQSLQTTTMAVTDAAAQPPRQP